MHYPRRQNVTTSVVGLKMVTYAKLSPKMVNPTDIAGNAEEEEGEGGGGGEEEKEEEEEKEAAAEEEEEGEEEEGEKEEEGEAEEEGEEEEGEEGEAEEEGEEGEEEEDLLSTPYSAVLAPASTRCPLGPVVKASTPSAAESGLIPARTVDLFPGRVVPVT